MALLYRWLCRDREQSRLSVRKNSELFKAGEYLGNTFNDAKIKVMQDCMYKCNNYSTDRTHGPAAYGPHMAKTSVYVSSDNRVSPTPDTPNAHPDLSHLIV